MGAIYSRLGFAAQKLHHMVVIGRAIRVPLVPSMSFSISLIVFGSVLWSTTPVFWRGCWRWNATLVVAAIRINIAILSFGGVGCRRCTAVGSRMALMVAAVAIGMRVLPFVPVLRPGVGPLWVYRVPNARRRATSIDSGEASTAVLSSVTILMRLSVSHWTHTVRRRRHLLEQLCEPAGIV